MIAIDTSALMAVILSEPESDACIAVLAEARDVIISAGTLAEALIVAGRRGVTAEMVRLIEGLHVEIVPVTLATARRVAEAYEQWGKGVHSAGLNFGDCFAYAAARERSCPLLFVGEDFAKTDIVDARAG